MQTMIYVGSVSKAMGAKRLLEQQGIRAYIRQSTRQDKGCGYSLFIPKATPQITALLRAHGYGIADGQRRDGG